MLSLMLSLWVVPVLAEDAEMGGLHCGDVVTITATPDVGYRFVRWSDGNTDNPREIEITQAVNLYAEYAPICQTATVPVLWLYDQLMMVNVDSLQRMGYIFSEQSVSWYRIVGDTDADVAEQDDQLLATGYFYNLLPGQTGTFYAAVDISATPPVSPPRCSDILYSVPIQRGQTGLDDMLIDGEISLLPNYVRPGTPMEVRGLNAKWLYTMEVYDAVGRKIEEYTSYGKESYTLIAQQIPGYYLVRVTSKDGEVVLKYVVKQ